jgi:phage tail-like protein
LTGERFNGLKRRERATRRKNLSIHLLDEAGESQVAWNVTEAWIAEWHATPFNASDNSVAIEECVLTCETVERA